MPRKGMRTVFFSAALKSPSPSHSSLTPRHTLSASMIEENVDHAESIIRKWDIEGSDYVKVASLFADNRSEAKNFLKAVKDLQSAMHYFISDDSSSQRLIRAQKLMQVAMKRLEKEFYQILSVSRNFLDPETVSSRASTRSSLSDFEDDASEDEIQEAGGLISEAEKVSELAMTDLQAIADCMISSGYGKECVNIYKIMRKSIVDESLYHLGIERLSSSQIQKMDWEVLEVKMKNWLKAARIAVKTLFYGERILSDHVFSASETIRDSCFAEITKEVALMLFAFPESVAKHKKTPEKLFSILDLYESISDLWPEIESIFSHESTSAVRSQTVTSLLKLGEAARVMLSDFEAAIEKDSSKTAVPGGGIHPLTRYVMNYVIFLSDYSGALTEIIADWPLSVQSPMPEAYFSSPISDESPASALFERLAWILLVLVCKLDVKANLYKEVSQSYLFLTNNLNYIVSKVQTSNLKLLLGEDWLAKHEKKVRQFAANYERLGWSKVMEIIPENPKAVISHEAAKDYLRKFNSSFQEEYRKQSSWLIVDKKLRDEIKQSLARKLVPAYRDLYEKHQKMHRGEASIDSSVKFSPDGFCNYLSDLFYGDGGSSRSSTSSSSSSSWRDRRHH